MGSIRMTIMRRTLLIGLVALVAAAPAARLDAKSSSFKPLLEAVIDSLAMAADAQAAMARAGTNDAAQVTSTRTAITKLNGARRLVDAFAKSDDEVTSDLASGFSEAYENVVGALTKNLQALESRTRPGAPERQVLVDETDEAWQALEVVVGLSVYALVDRDKPDPDGEFRHLQITRKDGADLQSRLERRFTRQALQRLDADAHGAEFAATALWQFLAQPDWKSSDAR